MAEEKTAKRRGRIFSRFTGLRKKRIGRRGIIGLILIGILITFIVLSLRGSKDLPFLRTESPVGIEGEPRPFDIPNQDPGNAEGLNLSRDFDIPGFTPPADVISDYEQIFNGQGSGGDWEWNPQPGQSGVGDGPPIPPLPTPPDSPPDWEPPAPPEGPNPGDEPPVPTGPDSGPGTDGPVDFEPPTPNTSDSPGNFSLPDRLGKARNLPMIPFIDLTFLDLSFIEDLGVEFSVSDVQLFFTSVLFFSLYLSKFLLPFIITKLETQENGEGSLVVKPSKRKQAKKILQSERERRLLVFRDHVDLIIERTKQRIEIDKPSQNIVTGYHELDNAFGEFAKLNRSRDITPLEHARTHFETGEINNEMLEKIVELFYLTRFSTIKASNQDVYQFIGMLTDLVVEGKTPAGEWGG